MSEEENTTDAAEETSTEEAKPKVVEIVTDYETGTTEVHQINEDEEAFVQREGYKLVVGEFGGKTKGLAFYHAQADSIEYAIEKYGADVILACVNNELRNGTKRRVTGTKVPKFEDEKATAKAIEGLKAKPILFSQEEAEAFVPGERERSFGGVVKDIKAAKAAGNFDKVTELMEELHLVMDRDRERSGLTEG